MIVSGLFGLLIMSSISCCVLCFYAFVLMYDIGIKFDMIHDSLICILLSASRDVHFDKRMICFLSGLL